MGWRFDLELTTGGQNCSRTIRNANVPAFNVKAGYMVYRHLGGA
jgi:hypothetical protein